MTDKWNLVKELAGALKPQLDSCSYLEKYCSVCNNSEKALSKVPKELRA